MNYLESFFDELEKISEESNEGLKLMPYLKASIPAAAGVGLGYATGRLLGKPLQEAAIQYGLNAGPAKVLRYAVPTAAITGALYKLTGSKLISDILEKAKRGDTKRKDTG